MRPKKAKEFVKPTAHDLDLPESLVDDVVSFYWSYMQKTLSNLESVSVLVSGLGTFKVRKTKIARLQAKYNQHLKYADMGDMTFNKHSIIKNAEFKLERLKALEKEFEEELKKKEEIRKKREAYVNSKNLEK